MDASTPMPSVLSPTRHPCSHISDITSDAPYDETVVGTPAIVAAVSETVAGGLQTLWSTTARCTIPNKQVNVR
uniref:Uncharacterized protein n=1 Tax=Oryza punctata TaxID=4537 RepID=A0A0E0MGY2_ORYPU